MSRRRAIDKQINGFRISTEDKRQTSQQLQYLATCTGLYLTSNPKHRKQIAVVNKKYALQVNPAGGQRPASGRARRGQEEASYVVELVTSRHPVPT